MVKKTGIIVDCFVCPNISFREGEELNFVKLSEV